MMIRIKAMHLDTLAIINCLFSEPKLRELRYGTVCLVTVVHFYC